MGMDSRNQVQKRLRSLEVRSEKEYRKIPNLGLKQVQGLENQAAQLHQNVLGVPLGIHNVYSFWCSVFLTGTAVLFIALNPPIFAGMG